LRRGAEGDGRDEALNRAFALEDQIVALTPSSLEGAPSKPAMFLSIVSRKG
jgi:hypothetical protein